MNQAIPLWLKDEVAVQRGLPVYMQLKESLRTAILSRRLEPGSPLPEERELAVLLKLSRGTVRRALEFLVHEKLIVRHHGRRSMVAQAERLPAMALALNFEQGASLDESTYLGLIVQAMAQNAAALGAELLLRDGSARRTALSPAAHLFIMGCADETMRGLARSGERVISVDTVAEGDGIDSVVYDNAGVFADATRRLIALGHRRIAYVDIYLERPQGRIINPNSALRMNGYLVAMAEAGLPPLISLQNLNPDVMASALQPFLAQAKPTALAVFDETAVLGACRAAQALGLSVPRDLSIVTLLLKDVESPCGMEASGGVVSQIELSRLAIARAIARSENRSLAGGSVIKSGWTWREGVTVAAPRTRE